MDPIHPIVPVTPHLLPVLPSPKIGAVEREAPQDKPDRRRRQRREHPEDGDRAPLEDAGEDDGLGHIDLTA